MNTTKKIHRRPRCLQTANEEREQNLRLASGSHTVQGQEKDPNVLVVLTRVQGTLRFDSGRPAAWLRFQN